MKASWQATFITLGGAASIIAAVFTVLSTNTTLQAVHLCSTLALIVTCVTMQIGRDKGIPFLARPLCVVAAALVIGSWAASGLPEAGYVEYLTLWVTQVASVVIAVVITQSNANRQVANRWVKEGTLKKGAFGLFLLSLAAAIVFFATMGVPALGANIEQGRVDAAAEGTGYLRLLAYLSIPAAQLLVVMRWRWAPAALLASALVVLGMANRSPLVYLLIPLIFVLFAQGRIRLNSLRVLSAAVVAIVLVGALGTYRVLSQDEFARYDEYRADISSGNVLGVAATSVGHYASVVTENAVLTKSLVDEGDVPMQFGFTYATLFVSAAPGEQLSLDRTIKAATGRTFVGGGTPPTFMGEGYANFGLPGIFLATLVVVGLLRSAAKRLSRELTADRSNATIAGFSALIYGFLVTWVAMAQVAGLAGASTFPLAAALTFAAFWLTGTRREESITVEY